MRILSLLFAGILAIGIPLAAQPVHCTPDTVTGTYALAYEGTVLITATGSPQPAAIPGVGLAMVSIDSKGAMTATGVQNIGGAAQQFPFMPMGSVTVNSDCTGAVNWSGGGVATMVVLGEGQELNTMMTQCGPGMGGPCVIYGTWKRISRTPATVVAAQCSPGSIGGTYAYREHGYMMAPQAGSPYPQATPVASAAVASLGADGTPRATGVASIGGQIVPLTAAAGTWQLKSDCTASMTFNFTVQGVPMGQGQEWAVVLDGGNEIWGIEMQSPMGQPVVIGIMRRISPIAATSK
jgi:hypothetical protein